MSFLSTRARGARLVLLGLLTLAAAVLVPSAAADAALLPGVHTCELFGSTNDTYRAAQCIDADAYVTSSGLPSRRAYGSTYCQFLSTGAPAACAGITQTVTVTRVRGADTETKSSTYSCGTRGGGACPGTGRFQNFSPAILCTQASQTFTYTVRSTVQLLSGTTSRSDDLSVSRVTSC